MPPELYITSMIYANFINNLFPFIYKGAKHNIVDEIAQMQYFSNYDANVCYNDWIYDSRKDF